MFLLKVFPAIIINVNLDDEKYYARIEYKQKLSNMDHNKIQKYAQMRF